MRDDQLARLQVPQPDRLVGAAGDHQAGLLGNRDRIDLAGVAADELARELGGRAVILDQRAVIAAGDQARAVADQREGGMQIAVGGVVLDLLRPACRPWLISSDGILQIRPCRRPRPASVQPLADEHGAAEARGIALERRGVLEEAVGRRQVELHRELAHHLRAGDAVRAGIGDAPGDGAAVGIDADRRHRLADALQHLLLLAGERVPELDRMTRAAGRCDQRAVGAGCARIDRAVMPAILQHLLAVGDCSRRSCGACRRSGSRRRRRAARRRPRRSASRSGNPASAWSRTSVPSAALRRLARLPSLLPVANSAPSAETASAITGWSRSGSASGIGDFGAGTACPTA